MWQYGLLGTFTAVNFIYNAGAQYGAVVIVAMADGNVTKLPSMLFEPIAGLRVSCQFIKAAQTAAERQARVATLAAFLLPFTGAAVGSNTAYNAGLGGLVVAYTAHMRDILKIRGGQILGSVKTSSKLVMIGSNFWNWEK